jgi:hypothetical protein
MIPGEKQSRRLDTPQAVSFSCACGATWRQMMKHYERVMCKCQRVHWVLQPRRDGPFVGFPCPPPILEGAA